MKVNFNQCTENINFPLCNINAGDGSSGIDLSVKNNAETGKLHFVIECTKNNKGITKVAY
jgi:hypothetical protein